MMQRLLLLTAGLTVLALAGCGTNASTGLSGISLIPDLVAEAVDPDTTLKMGTTNKVMVTVSNRGGADARRFSVRVRVDWILVIGNNQFPRSDIGTAVVEQGLGAGQVELIEVLLPMQDSGSEEAGSFVGDLILTVDYRGEVIESDESNNVLVEEVLVTWDATNTGTDVNINKVNN